MALPSKTFAPSTQANRDLNQACHELARAAEAELGASGYDALRRVACEFRDGILTLRGRVATFYLKQVAQCTLRDFVLTHAAIDRIDNQIEVYVLTPK